MTAAPRPARAPALIAGCWAVSVVTGAGLLAVGPVAPRPEPAELSPYSLAAYLTRVAGPDARDIRVNGVYGSGHDGAWQFTAHLSWRDAGGTVRGGTTTLPQLAGSDPLQTDLADDRLQAEQDVGWSLSDLDAALDQLTGLSDPLAMVELEILPDGTGDVTSCHSAASGAAAGCRTVSREGEFGPSFTDALSDSPLADALSVQRARQP
jgi:hypothetical protein